MELDEMDLDKFLKVHSKFKHKNFIDKDDFDAIFRKPVLDAKQDTTHLDTFQYKMDLMRNETLNQRDLEFQESVKRGDSLSHSMDLGMATMTPNKRQSIMILINCFKNTNADEIMQDVENKADGGSNISARDFKIILQSSGGVNSTEAQKVCNLLSVDPMIPVPSIKSLLNEAKVEARKTNSCCRIFDQLILAKADKFADAFQT